MKTSTIHLLINLAIAAFIISAIAAGIGIPMRDGSGTYHMVLAEKRENGLLLHARCVE